MGHKKRVLLKKIRNHLQPLKLQKNKTLLQICITGRQDLEKLHIHMQLEIPSCLGSGPKIFNF